MIACRTRLLTPEQAEMAVRRRGEIGLSDPFGPPPDIRTITRRRGGERRLALLKESRWPATGVDLTVQFLDTPPQALRDRILLHMNAWNDRARVRFRETHEEGQVRIARMREPEDEAGYWSYVGTQILGIGKGQPTMNLEGFTMRTSEAEFRRVVRHEAGHTLGFEHEHMRSDLVKLIDRKKAYSHFHREYGWTAAETEEQVLTPLKERSLMGTLESDPLSIMCYQIPGKITKNGKPIPGGRDINESDHAFAAKVYPKSRPSSSPGSETKPELEAKYSVSFARPPGPDETLQITVLDGFDPETGASGAKQDKPKFARILASYAGARVVEPMQLKAVDKKSPTRFGNIIAIHERIKAYTNRDSGSLPTDAELLTFGQDLFDTLFRGEVRRLYDEARALQQGRKLDLVLTSMIPWIAEKPWEFAFDSTRRSFLATEDVQFIRNAMAAVPAERIKPKTGPLRILVASAQPIAFGRLSVEQEQNAIGRGFQGLIKEGLVEIEKLPRVSSIALQARLSTERFDIVHFIGHGVFDEDTGVGALVFEEESGGSKKVEERGLREIFCGRGLSMVFLNACQSGSGGRADFNKGVAQALVSHGLPALVANQYSVLDSSATSFAQHFYWALAQGMGIGQAAREARIAVNCLMRGDVIDWAVPVVYARDPRMVLCEQPVKRTPPPATAERAHFSRRREADVLRIAVTDIDGVFPGLADTLARMTGAQPVFEFARADLSPPLDIWDLETKAPDGNPYLRAEKLAHRMETAATELGVHVLICITRHWMRSDNMLNLYGWWPDERNPPVLISSFAGFEELLAEGQSTDRALANMAVSGLAGYFGDVGSHDRGPRSCPLWSNMERTLSGVIGPLKFDRACQQQLSRACPRELKALEALLRVFH